MSCPVECDGNTEYATHTMETLPSVMRAVRVHKFGGPEVLKLDVDVSLPTYTDTQVLIKVFTVGINPCETYARAGHFGIGKLPAILGTDCAGVVVRVGSSMTKVKCGERVYTVNSVSGSYAQFTVVEERHVFHLHDDLTFSHGAALGVPYFTAYRALFYKAECQRGETVLVHGASGGVGMACCQIAHAYGLNVLATAGTERGLEALRANKITQVFNHNHKGYLKQIEKAAGEHGIDIVCEMLACKNLKNDIPLLGTNGRIIVIGARDQASFSPTDLFFGEKRIQGVAIFCTTEEEFTQMAVALDKGAEAGWLRPVIAREYPLDEVAAAHREIIEHHEGSAGKLIMSI